MTVTSITKIIVTDIHTSLGAPPLPRHSDPLSGSLLASDTRPLMPAVEPLTQASAKLASSAPPGPCLIRSVRALPSRTSNRPGCLEEGHSIPRGIPLSLDQTACEQLWLRRLPRLLASRLDKAGGYACSTFSASVIAPSPALPNYLPRRSLKIRVIHG